MGTPQYEPTELSRLEQYSLFADSKRTSSQTLYTIFLPRTYNDGRRIPEDVFDHLLHTLVTFSGGCTYFLPCLGFWINAASQHYGDVIVPVQVLLPTNPETETWVRRWALEALTLFQQEALFVLGQATWQLPELAVVIGTSAVLAPPPDQHDTTTREVLHGTI